MRDQISELTTNRLSLYSRFLSELDEKGVKTVSSKVLAEQFGLNAVLSEYRAAANLESPHVRL